MTPEVFEAVKAYRNEHGCSLREAMTAVENGWRPHLRDTADAILRDALAKQGPRAHAMDCGTTVDKPCDCWMGRGRRLLGMESEG